MKTSFTILCLSVLTAGYMYLSDITHTCKTGDAACGLGEGVFLLLIVVPLIILSSIICISIFIYKKRKNTLTKSESILGKISIVIPILVIVFMLLNHIGF